MDWESILFRDMAMAREPVFAEALGTLGAAALRLACRDGRAAVDFIVRGGGEFSPELQKAVWIPKVSDAMRLWTVGEMEAAGVPFNQATSEIAMETISDHCKLSAFLHRFSETKSFPEYNSLNVRHLPPGADIRNLRAATDLGINLDPDTLALIARWECPKPEETRALYNRHWSRDYMSGDAIWKAMSVAMDAGNVDIVHKLQQDTRVSTFEFLKEHWPDSRLAGRVFDIHPRDDKSRALVKLVVSAGEHHGPEELRRVLALFEEPVQISPSVFALAARGGDECADILVDRVVYSTDRDFANALMYASLSCPEETALSVLKKLDMWSRDQFVADYAWGALEGALECNNFRAALWVVRRFPGGFQRGRIPEAQLTENSGDDVAAHLRDFLDHMFTNFGTSYLDPDSVRMMLRSKAPEEHVLACTEILMEFGARHRAEDIIAALTRGFPAVARMLAARAEAAHKNRASDAVALLCVEHCMNLAPRDIALLLRWANH